MSNGQAIETSTTFNSSIYLRLNTAMDTENIEINNRA